LCLISLRNSTIFCNTYRDCDSVDVQLIFE
jgi:hypothetical protein